MQKSNFNHIQQDYQSPAVEIFGISVEKGFADSPWTTGLIKDEFNTVYQNQN